ncbi:MAG: tetratricopeptide repeat protein [Pseudomonadota bacterium]
MSPLTRCALIGVAVMGVAILGAGAAAAQTTASAGTVGSSVDLNVSAPPPPIDPKTAVRDGAAALVSKKPRDAVRYFTAALGRAKLRKEERALLLNDRGVAHARAGDTIAAITDFNAAVGLYPEYAAIYNNRGTVLLDLGLTDEAVRDFDRAILLGPRYASAHTNRAVAHLRAGRLDPALEDFDTATRLRPGDAAGFLGRGRLHLTAGRPFAAERDLSKGIALAPKFTELYEQRWQARDQIGRRSGAFDDLNQLVALRADDVDGLVARGSLYLAQGSRKSALADFETALAQNARSLPAYVGKARTLLAYRRVPAAREQANMALSLDPEHPDALAVDAAVALAEDDAARAVRQARAAIAARRGAIEAHLTKAAALEALGDVSGAAAAYTVVHRLAPTNSEARKAVRRLTGSLPEIPPRIVTGAGLDAWQVSVTRSADGGTRRFAATNSEIKGLRIPLETYGDTPPRVVGWERKTGAFRGIGVLRYAAGTRQMAGKRLPVEQAVVVDLRKRTVLGIEPVRTGDKVAAWNWEAGNLSVRGADGLVSTYAVGRSAAAIAAARARTRRAKTRQRSQWLEDPWGIGTGRVSQPRKAKRKNRRPRRRKKKSLFDLLFQ